MSEQLGLNLSIWIYLQRRDHLLNRPILVPVKGSVHVLGREVSDL